MKKNPENGIAGKLKAALSGLIAPLTRHPGVAAASIIAFAGTVFIVVGKSDSAGGLVENVGDFEAGRVAGRDVVAHENVVYVDEEATGLRIEAQEKLVPAVFRFSEDAAAKMRDGWKNFGVFAGDLFGRDVSAEAAKRALQAEFPGLIPANVLDVWLSDSGREMFCEYGAVVLEHIIGKGVFAIPETGLEQYNPDVAELLSSGDTGTERELISYGTVVTKARAAGEINHFIAGGTFPPSFALVASEMLLPFITENVFFSPEDTRQRIAEARSRVEPVLRRIDRGKRVIRKDFVITDEDMRELRELNMNFPRRDPRGVINQILILLLLFVFLVFFCGKRMAGRALSDPEAYLVIAVTALYLSGAVFARGLFLGADLMPVSFVVPTALAVMLPAILITPRLALFLGMVLPLGAFLTGSFDTSAYIFALVSGITASHALQGAQRRMDLVKAGLVIAAANAAAAMVILLSRRAGAASWPATLFWAAFNGLASGMLVLGFLPPLEHALNAATSFRLIELSDLNAPLLRRLFAAAPGTYSHSIMVANLAEAACQDIGANALLARVGAYYHDVGKMDQPDYFVENQTVYNKHDDTPPRLSATVIRSHVKLGVEKARSLGLPRQVTDIIAEHHGDSVISWFYNKALKQEDAHDEKKSPVNMEDFTYPGNPPRSRESAVVMLADVTEAAVRTLNKPTAGKMEKFIQGLINDKVEHGQLVESELTFRDLETIKKAFVRVLAGHYHSRIEYPKQGGKEIPASVKTGEGES